MNLIPLSWPSWASLSSLKQKDEPSMGLQWPPLPDWAALRQGITQIGRREEIRVISPFSGRPIATIPACTPDDIGEAFDRAHKAQQAWSRQPIAARIPLFWRFYNLLHHHRSAVLDIIQIESGKTRLDALEELLDLFNNIRYYATRAPQWLAPTPHRGALPLFTVTEEHHQPLGIVGLIAPWNYPLVLTMGDALPALLAGNGVVMKPSEQTSFTALFVAQLLYQAGLPRDLLQIVTGRGEEIGPALIAASDFLSFTGSTAVGRLVAQQAGQQLIACSLELGGKNPLIVFNSADLRATITGAVRACFANAGQLCISAEKLFVQEGHYEQFVRDFVFAVRDIPLQASFSFIQGMGSLSSAEQLAKVSHHVEDARTKGATILTGGQARPEIGPYFYEPTVITHVTPQMALFAEESFGPVVAIYPFASAEQVIEQANATEYGLNASLWGRDSAELRAIATRLRFGTVTINDGYAATWGSVDSPMGGMKASGLGRRHGKAGLLKYTESQTIATQRGLSFGPWPFLGAKQYAQTMVSALHLLRTLRY